MFDYTVKLFKFLQEIVTCNALNIITIKSVLLRNDFFYPN